MFFVLRCFIFSSFRRMCNNFVTFCYSSTIPSKKKNNIYIIYIGNVAFNHFFNVENLVIISIRDHISLRRCPYFPSMGLDRCALFLWRRCVLRKCKLVSYNSRLYIYRQSVFVCIYISQRFQIVLYSDVFYDAI